MDTNSFDRSRVINFSDAVFSIAGTLLVLELSIPGIDYLRENGIMKALQLLVPSFIGLIISFLVIALYWTAHLRVMKFVDTVDGKLLWLNIFLLFFVVLLPFSTAFYVTGVQLTGPFVFYCLNLAAIGLFNWMMVRYVLKTQAKGKALTIFEKGYHHWRSANTFFVWAAAGGLAPFFPVIARFLWILIFVFQFLITRHFKRKQKKALG